MKWERENGGGGGQVVYGSKHVRESVFIVSNTFKHSES